MMTEQIIMAGQVAGALSAIGAVVYVIVKYVVVRPIQNYIDKATYQIQPFANGGKSLPDLVKLVTLINQRLDGLETRIHTIESKVCNPTRGKSQKA